MKNCLYCCLLIALCLCEPAYGQLSGFMPSTMNVAGIAAARTDRWSAFHNPASLVQQAAWQVAVQYENRYLTAELSTEMIQAAYCNDYVNVGVAYSFFGYGKYSEMMAGITLARRFADRFSLGLQADLIAVYCGDNVGYKLTGIPQIGATVDITANLTLGIETFNPFIQSLPVNEQQIKLPAIYTIATDYRFYKGLRWDAEVSYNTLENFRVATGFEWQAIEQLCIKLGAYYQQYIIGNLGVGLTFKDLSIDINAHWHPVLGVQLATKVGYSWQ